MTDVIIKWGRKKYVPKYLNLTVPHKLGKHSEIIEFMTNVLQKSDDIQLLFYIEIVRDNNNN